MPMQNHVIACAECSGCGACADICPKNAIMMEFNDAGLLYPRVNESACIACDSCKTVCPCCQDHTYPPAKAAYIAVCRKTGLVERSSSGGIFAAMAETVLARRGAVYGAAIMEDDDGLDCRTVRVESDAELYKIQGSKYVHCRTDRVFREIRALLQKQTPVLFSGTSCQVAALKLFLQKEYSNLYTIDLVCHGVPELSHFREYIKSLEKKYKTTVHNVTFRNKSAAADNEGGDAFVLNLECGDSETNKLFRISIPKYLSAYYAMFLSRANYRPNCYCCPYASIKKPGDITLGDFMPTKEELERFSLDEGTTYSSVFIRTEKGRALMDMVRENCRSVEIPLEDILRHHKNLQKPSEITAAGKRYRQVYRLFGFSGLERALEIKNCLFQGKR